MYPPVKGTHQVPRTPIDFSIMEKLQDFWNNLLSRFDSEESIIFSAFMIGAFLLGLLLGWLIHGSRARKRRREIERLQNEMADWRVKNAKLQEELELKDADLIRASREVEEWSQTVKELHSERDQIRTQLVGVQRSNEELEQSTNGYIQTIEDLNNQILGLKARTRQTSGSEGNGMSYGSGLGSTGGSDQEVRELRTQYEVAMDRIQRLEARMESIHGQPPTADSDITRGRGIENEPPLVAAASLPPLEDSDRPGLSLSELSEEDNTPFDEELTGRGALTDRLGAKIPAPIATDGDDLTKINGVGPFLAKQLNEVGVYHYEQIAGWNDQEIERITEAIGHFPGRIKRDDWVGQAEGLLKQQNEADDDELIGDASDEPGAYAATNEDGVIAFGTTDETTSQAEADVEDADLTSDADTDTSERSKNNYSRIELGSSRGMQAETQNSEDLKIVEGIGPKIEELLKHNGIPDIKSLSEVSYERLREILDSGGKRYRMHDPMTWPTQAALALVGKWRQLDELQEKLKGGRDVGK